jgi:AAA family ATP:ADP antiporter
VVGYTLAKPAREVLFTVTTREEKYKAKICIDTLILRGGDTLAAGLFHILDGVWEMGPSGCAAAAFPLCVACSGVAYALGRAHRDAAARLRGGSLENRARSLERGQFIS